MLTDLAHLPIAVKQVVESDSDYATIGVIAFDGEAIADPRRLLVQIGSVARPTGWATEAASVTPKKSDESIAGLRITATGKGPWQLTRVEGRLAIHNPHLGSARRLDPNGYPDGAVAAQRENETLALELPGDCLYLVIEE